MVDAAYSDEQLLMIARLYYVDGLSQADVARMANVSQAKISRLLARARKKGLVRITVAEYDTRNRALEEELEHRLGIRRAVVIKVAQGLPVEELRQSLAHFAAPWVAEMVQPGDVLAIAGGRAMQWLVQNMIPPPDTAGVTVVQAMGNIGASVGPYDALELGRIVASRFGGTFLTLNTPVLVPDARTRKTLLELDTVRQVMERLGGARMALVGVGTLENSVFVERGVLTEKDIKRLARAGAVGEICGRFFDRRGKQCDTTYRNRVLSIDLDDLRRIDEVIAVVAGSDRTEAIRGALRGGLIKSLVIDETGAEALLKEAEKP